MAVKSRIIVNPMANKGNCGKQTDSNDRSVSKDCQVHALDLSDRSAGRGERAQDLPPDRDNFSSIFSEFAPNLNFVKPGLKPHQRPPHRCNFQLWPGGS